MRPYKSIEWLAQEKAIRLIDQKALPSVVEYNNYSTVNAVAQAINDMTVRGAPVIGVAAAYGLVIAVFNEESNDVAKLAASMVHADRILRASRPTAVNLFWALDQMAERVAKHQPKTAAEYRQLVLACAQELEAEDIAINKNLSTHALTLLPKDKVTFIHHCNTGALATVDYGTALGVIRMAHESGRQVHVFVDETRPRLQGARLTSWELQQQGISHQLIVDGASSHVMQKFAVDMCVVGCDRVAANGDFANKVGTCNLAMVAKANGVPFYVAAPLSTIDLETSCGADIEIEERASEEVTEIDGARVAPDGIDVYNPAFDVTPAEFITAIITEKGIVYPPFLENLQKIKEL
ncbi:methylthioribose-1-phosphate isomerase [Colwellia chukchiensis]|uniref:Methylthioribose-1-phosphate isomerase n=1 Tax=Colwellia chukchiensis TaxID=641665 RepID=A0A1H7M4F9_9GAMM|nr:S-methyl-5-thioribose-1-phosphate isomerase [Colwellia chukchiensis]SEL06021.1 methylthioribose-1-phosphate isomerase [Colwellia chukchiensis]